MPFKIIRSDITKVHADAIVNTANPHVAVGAGVDSAIYAAAGRDRLLKARAKVGTLAAGEVGITKAFDLPARYIIHSSGPAWVDGRHQEPELLRGCYDKALVMAYAHRCKSIAFPLMATGSYGFPKELGIQIAIDAFTSFLQEHEMDITLVVFDDHSYHVSGKWYDDVKSFIDDEYVAEKNLSEYRTLSSYDECQDTARFDEEYLCGQHRPQFMEYGTPAQSGKSSGIHENTSNGSLDDMLKGIYTDSFEKHLQQLINKKGLKNSEVYTAANISKQYFSKLLKGRIKPSKEKVLSLAVGLHLNLDETVDFLGLAGYALSPISQTDKIVEYHIVHKEYSVIKINIVLFDYGLASLSE